MKSLLIGLILLAHPLYKSIAQTSKIQIKAETFEEAKISKQATLKYLYTDINGFITKSESGNINGLLASMMRLFERYLLKEYGITISSEYIHTNDGDFAEFLSKIKNGSGGVFGLHTTTIKKERESIIKFSPPILNNIMVMISDSSIPTITTLDSNNKSKIKFSTAYAVPGSTSAERIENLINAKKFPDLEMKLVQSQYDVMDLVMANSQSFGFVDISYYIEYLKLNKPVKRHPVGDLLGEQLAIVMPLNSDWDPIFADFISIYTTTAEYRTAVTQNLGKSALRMVPIRD